MRITLATASKSISGTALALRQTIWRKQDPSWHVCGLPEILYSDNGSDFTSQHLEQVGADLIMQLVFSTPGIPRGRGRIELFFATLTQMFLCDLPGYVPPKGGMRGKTRAHTSGAGPLVGRFFCGGLPQARAQRDKGITIGALGSRWLYTKNARFAYGDATHCGERYRFLVQTSSQNS